MAEGVTGSSLTPGTEPRSSLVRQVLRFIGAPNDTDAKSEAVDAINEAINELNMRAWNALRNKQDITLDTTNSTYDLQADYHDSRNAALLDSNSIELAPLDFYEPKEFERVFPDRTITGNVVAYTIQNYADELKLELSAVPNADFIATYPTLRHRYYRNLQYLTGDGSELGAPAKFELFVKWRSREILTGIHDPSRVGYPKQKADEMWLQLMRDDKRQGMRDYR